MRLPLRKSQALPRFLLLLVNALMCFALSHVYGQVQVPIPLILNEIDNDLKNPSGQADAAAKLDLVLDRVIKKSEALPQGITVEKLLPIAANTHFQLQNFSRAEELASELLKKVSTGGVANDMRLVLGLALALQNKYAQAEPVFGELEQSSTYREKAILYRAMSAQAANKNAIAIDAYTRYLKDARRDSDWMDAAFTLIFLHLQEKNIEEANNGLLLLRSDLDKVDNLAGLNALSLQLGDSQLQAKNTVGALTAYRTVFPRATLLTLQKQRTARMEENLARLKALRGTSVTALQDQQRIEQRIKATKQAMDEIAAKADYDSVLYYRLGTTFQQRGGEWEAALLFERVLKDFPQSIEIENTYISLAKAYADSGRLAKLDATVDRFIKAYPESKLLPQALFIAAQAAFERGKTEMQMKFLDIGVNNYPAADLAEYMLLMQANAHFATGKFSEARAAAVKYVEKYPQGKFTEDAGYLRTMATLVLGQNAEALQEIETYLSKYPEGRFVADARYRAAASEFALLKYDLAEKRLNQWLKDYPPEQPQRGEVLSTLGDVYVGLNNIDSALESYRAALAQPLSDEQLGYVLDEATKQYQVKRDYNSAALMWEDFAREKPDHPFVINAAFWIGKLRAKEGRTEDAIEQMSTIARRYIKDPSRDTVERLLTQIAAQIARPPKMGKDGKRPPLPTIEELTVKVETALLTDDSKNNPTAKARVLFTLAEIASLRKNTILRDQYLVKIAQQFAPETLSPGLLGKVGDLRIAEGAPDKAKPFFEQLVTQYPKSIYADFGYVGLGEISFLSGDYDIAYLQYSNAIDRAGARFKLMDATLGQAKTLLGKGKLEEARTMFEQIASNRQWRGAATAESVFSLGEIYARMGGPDNLAKAQANFQRVYLTYRKFTTWVARSYLRSGETFEQLGQLKEALATYKELLRDSRLSEMKETTKARERIAIIEPQVATEATPVTTDKGKPATS